MSAGAIAATLLLKNAEPDNTLFMHVYKTAAYDVISRVSNLSLSYEFKSFISKICDDADLSYDFLRLKLQLLYKLHEVETAGEILTSPVRLAALRGRSPAELSSALLETEFVKRNPELLDALTYSVVQGLWSAYESFETLRKLSRYLKYQRDLCEAVSPAVAACFDQFLVKKLYGIMEGYVYTV